jgi:cell wall-associated NlpC family hydrolase
MRLSLLVTISALVLGASACGSSPERQLNAQFDTWKGTPYLENGTTRKGISNAAFVQSMFRDAFGVQLPATRDEQFHTGKLVERKDLKPGDLVFFDVGGFFKSRVVGIYLGHDEVALAKRDLGVAKVELTKAPWTTAFKTARRISTDPNAGPPVFDASKYGSNRGALLRDIAVAWTGTLYLDNGTTFDGIGNYEYVRSVYEGIYDAELEGTPANWLRMGVSVSRDSLEPGDIILYQATGIGAAFGRKHAGIYIGDGEFTHCVKGAAVTISRLDDPRWSKVFTVARRIDPDVEARLRAERASAKPAVETKKRGKTPRTPPVTATTPPVAPPANTTTPHVESDVEKRLRAATASWRGTPYKIGGTTKAGVDCSAFVRAAYQEALSIPLPRTSAEQERLGKQVARTELKSGDLVFFRTQGMGPFFKSRHVGVYLGGGEFAQSSGSKGVTISRLDDYYWNRKYHGARRIAGE